ncbi:hypothetical protein C5167_050388 [Papaver somniferum]|uniref:Uncharacterized protein n=1 Tax=Papaver somniferum TaxID=3469 RepID=A0A4Y7KPZ9_PAPSO|nr:protein REVEILLE 7-like isoform X1 [Papaver somniferum]RZC74907.1 hypothetical protein C5167_050388 [Papaver somniferum]
MANQDKSCGSSSNATAMDDSQNYMEVGSQSGNAMQFKENYSSGEDNLLKARKPYTITKQRERWTEDEHKKFLEALRLYGRAWRRIEDHIGTKTAVQIRSHAQKFFSKVVRESGSNDAGSVKPIEIPPPRPKRKPMHPYPRKMVSSAKKQTLVSEKLERSMSPNFSTSEQENQSPASVLSVVGSDAMGSSFSNTQSRSQSPVSSVSDVKHVISSSTKQEIGSPSTSSLAEEENGSSCGAIKEQSSMKNDFCSKDGEASGEGVTEEAPVVSLKLFGRTVLVTDSRRPSTSLSSGVCKSLVSEFHQENSDTCDGMALETAQSNNMTQPDSFVGPSGSVWRQWPSALCNMQFQGVNSNAMEAAASAASSLHWWALYGGLQLPLALSFSNSLQVAPNSSPEDALREMKVQYVEEAGTSSATGTVDEVEISEQNAVNSRRRETVADNDIKEVDLVLGLKPRETSESLAQKSSSERRGFVPYKRCLSERSRQSSGIAGEDRDGQRMRLCL